MPYFLCDDILRAGQTFTFRGEEARHLLKSRRMRVGERFAVQDPDGRRFLAELVEQRGRDAIITILEPGPVPAPPSRAVTLLQATVKEKAAEWIVQKATELGAAEIVFFPSEFGTVPHKALNAPGAVARWERIAWEACKQSERQFPPRLSVAGSFDAALKAGAETAEVAWLLEPGGSLTIAEAVDGLGAGGGTDVKAVRILVGPEGGLSGDEGEAARMAGFVPVAMGGTVLRAETAALAACALALFG